MVRLRTGYLGFTTTAILSGVAVVFVCERRVLLKKRDITKAAPLAADIERVVTLFNQQRLDEGEALAKRLAFKFPKHPFAWKALGVLLLQGGKFSEALIPMQKAAALLPEEYELQSNLGVLLKKLGRLDEAVTAQRRALAIKPDYAEAHNNLGGALKEMGRFDDAVASYLCALEIMPDAAEIYNNLGIALYELGRLEEAEVAYRQALGIKPEYVSVIYNLGNLYKVIGRQCNAVNCYRRIIDIKPDCAEAYNALGLLLKEMGRYQESDTCFINLLELQPDNANVYVNRGALLVDMMQFTEAETCYRRAIQITPDCAEAFYNLGDLYEKLGNSERAEASYRQALEIKPGYAEALVNVGNILKNLGRMKEAEYHQRLALESAPDFAEAHSSLGVILQESGRFEEAEHHQRLALQLKQDLAITHSNLLFTLGYTASQSPLCCLEEARRYGEMVAKKAGCGLSTRQFAERPERLRVGFVSGDLLEHPVGHFLESLIAHITSVHSSTIELAVYTTNSRTDKLTTRIRPYFGIWRCLYNQSDELAASLIKEDGIHILIDLSGHTAHNRLPVFAWKPAPVQVSWLGYFATTGVTEIDYLLGDPYVTPNEEQNHFTEKIWRLPESYLCFTPPDIPLDVGVLPMLSRGRITFGCFNNLAKINDAVVHLWAKVLKAIPDSCLFLKTRQLNDPYVCDAIRHRFLACGILPDRLLLEGSSPRAELLDAYNRVDIALDPFPYPGGTTSAEALWMGVPVLTRRGDRFLSHVGESIAHNTNMVNWIATDDDDYVAKAIQYAADIENLAALRGGLRQQVLASPLCDAPRFARYFVDALWAMWQKWLITRAGG